FEVLVATLGHPRLVPHDGLGGHDRGRGEPVDAPAELLCRRRRRARRVAASPRRRVAASPLSRAPSPSLSISTRKPRTYETPWSRAFTGAIMKSILPST